MIPATHTLVNENKNETANGSADTFLGSMVNEAISRVSNTVGIVYDIFTSNTPTKSQSKPQLENKSTQPNSTFGMSNCQ